MIWNGQIIVTGVHELDEDHSKIKYMFDELGILIATAKNSLDILIYVLDIEKFVIYHFKREHELMDRYSYPLAAVHKQHHADFIKFLNDFKSICDDRAARLNGYNAFCKWFINHSMVCDVMLGKFIKGKLSCAK